MIRATVLAATGEAAVGKGTTDDLDAEIRAEAQAIIAALGGDIHRLLDIPLPRGWGVYADEQYAEDATVVDPSEVVTYMSPPPMAARHVGQRLYVVEADAWGNVDVGQYPPSEERRCGARLR